LIWFWFGCAAPLLGTGAAEEEQGHDLWRGKQVALLFGLCALSLELNCIAKLLGLYIGKKVLQSSLQAAVTLTFRTLE